MTDNDTGRLAVALDDLLLGTTPEVLAALYETCVPVDVRDQRDAAIRDTDLLARALAAMDGNRGHAADHRDIPEWLRLGVLDVLLRWAAGRADTCLHAPDARRGEPVHAAAWRPGLISCTPCSKFVFAQPRGSVADRTCDACGHVDADGILCGFIQFSTVIYWYGVCDDCRWETIDDDASTRTAP